MHYSIVKVAALALLELSTVFLGSNASPTGISVTENPSAENSVHELAARAKPVPRLRDYDYRSHSVPGFPGRPVRWTITKSGVIGFVDEIRVDRSLGVIYVENADNKKYKTDNKLKLSDIAMSLFVHESGKQPSDLTSVVFERISQDDVIIILRPVLEDAGYHPTKPGVTVTVTPTSRQQIFEALEKTPFCKMLRWLNTDFGVPAVTSYIISGPVREPFLVATLT